MNQNYNQTITLYNRIRAADSADKKEHWRRTVLPGCFWKACINTYFSDKEATSQNTYTVRIPENERYAPYADFLKRQKTFTVTKGDIVVCGVCPDEITGESGNTASEVLNRYSPSAFRVTAFSDNTAFPIAKHYRIGG